MTTHNPAQASFLGVANNGAAFVDDDAIQNTPGRTYALFRNTSGGTSTVQVKIPVAATRPGDETFPPQALAAAAVSIPTLESRLLGPFPGAVTGSTGLVSFDVTGTGVVCHAFNIA